MTSTLLDQDRITVASSFVPLLRLHGLDTFEKVMQRPGGQVMRDFPGRRTVRLELPPAPGSPSAVFLKRYEAGYLSAGRRLLRRLGWRSAQDEARREWEGLATVRSLGIATATPVAFGQELQGGLVTRSFLMTAEIVGGVDGERYLRSLSAPERGPFLGRVAELAKRLHSAGWVHKDLYVSHVLVAPDSGSGAELTLFLIDLQRLIQPASWRVRWQVKDLGALAYSALKAGASPKDLLTAWQRYCGTKELSKAQRSEARRVLRRVAWLKTRTPKHDKDFQQLK